MHSLQRKPRKPKKSPSHAGRLKRLYDRSAQTLGFVGYQTLFGAFSIQLTSHGVVDPKSAALFRETEAPPII